VNATGRTGSRKKDKRLIEKTVVPVVQEGKVGNLPMWLFGDGLGGCGVF
jgi:organic hydroperoxide reductase OsmC/OhrA